MTQPAAAIATHDETGKPVRVYRIPSPDTGDLMELPNISSVIDVLQTWGLSDWRLRMAAVGIVHRLDLQQAIAAASVMPGGRDRNRQILDAVSLAIDEGQVRDPDRGHLANASGSAIHLLTEHIDNGLVDDVLSLPASVAEHAAHYVDLMSSHGVEVVHSEFTVWSRFGYAGTGDRIVRITGAHEWTEQPMRLGEGCFVLDIKTGKAKPSAAMQLAALANADGIYNADTGRHEPLPDDLRSDVGFLLHLTNEGAALIPVDLTDAWPAFQGALAVKRFCDTKPLAPALRAAVSTTPDAAPSLADQLAASLEQVQQADADEATALLEDAAAVPPSETVPHRVTTTPMGTSEDLYPREVVVTRTPIPSVGFDRGLKTAWLVGRLKALLDLHPDIAVAWPEGVPTFRENREADTLHTADQLLDIERALADAERAVKAPFPPEDPSDLNVKVRPDDPRVVDFPQRIADLPADLRAELTEAAQVLDGRRFSIGTATEDDVTWWRQHIAEAEMVVCEREAIMAAALTLLERVDTDLLLGTVGNFVDAPTGWQVDRLADLGEAFDRGWLDDDLATTKAGIDHIVAEFGGRRAVLNAAKGTIDHWGWGDKPTKADDVFANPLLVAALALTESEPETIEGGAA